MKKILLIVTLMITSAFSYTQAELKKNYELCLDFTGEIDPKNPQITFEKCDEWIDRFENPKKYVKKEKNENSDEYRLSDSEIAQKLNKTKYVKYFDQFTTYEVEDEFGNKTFRKKNKGIYLFEKDTKNLKGKKYLDAFLDLTAELFAKSIYEGEITTGSNDSIFLIMIGQQRAAIIQREIEMGALPPAIQVNIVDTKSRKATFTASYDTQGLAAKLNAYLSPESYETSLDRAILLRSFFISHGYFSYDFPKSMGDVELQILFDLANKGNTDATTLITLVAKGDAKKVSRFMMKSKNTKQVFQKLRKKVLEIK